eukprot:TRINITY_DN62207_c0_g1_i1.p1 TRINITY_DN62207_c0_g1~~TRINITY_DN62207_c0_g1_i1.p1  ORF type:complete len:256 (+),score=39.38 TRINITY_DN62207_c0_g1_i1:85-768(+)
MPKFEINLGDRWGKFEESENETLLKAFMGGKKFAQFHSRGQDYYVDFAKMIQRNVKTGKERQIRVAYDEEGKKPAKPMTPKPSAEQALYSGPAAGSRPSAVAQGMVVGHTPGAASSGYSPGGVYEPGRPAAHGAHGVAPGPVYTPGGAMPYGSPAGAYGTPGPAYAAGAYAPPYAAGAAHAGPAYAPGPAYGPPHSGGGGGMGTGGAMLAAGGAGLLGGLLLGEIFD